MNCYDCDQAGRTVTATAVCSSCGAGMCPACAHPGTRDTANSANPGNVTHHLVRKMSCATCATCAAATDSHPLDRAGSAVAGAGQR